MEEIANYNINNISEIEGIRDFFIEQIYGDVYKYIDDYHLDEDPNNKIFNMALEIVSDAKKMPRIYFDTNMSEEEKQRVLNAKINEMYQKLYMIKSQMESGEKQKGI